MSDVDAGVLRGAGKLEAIMSISEWLDKKLHRRKISDVERRMLSPEEEYHRRLWRWQIEQPYKKLKLRKNERRN